MQADIYSFFFNSLFLPQQLNALNKGEEEDETISVAEMRSLAGYDDSLKEIPDYRFYIAYDFYAKNNSHFHRSPYYGYYQGNFSTRSHILV